MGGEEGMGGRVEGGASIVEVCPACFIMRGIRGLTYHEGDN